MFIEKQIHFINDIGRIMILFKGKIGFESLFYFQGPSKFLDPVIACLGGA
jgi:hypothetical protein